MKKLLLVLSIIVFLAAVFISWKAFSMPAMVQADIPLLNFVHEGTFESTAYYNPSFVFSPELTKSVPSHLPQTNPKYPIEAIDHFKFTINYSFLPDKPVHKVTEDVEVTATGTTSERKPVTLTLAPKFTETGNFSTDFEFAPTADILGNDMTINISVRPAIETDNGLEFESFNQSLLIHSNQMVLEIDRAHLKHSQSGQLGGLSYKQTGQINCSVVLKKDSVFGEMTLGLPEPSPSPTLADIEKTIGAGDVIFTKILDRLEMTYNYDLKADKPIKNLDSEVTISMVLENPKVWSKTLVLLPPTREIDSFSLSFPLDISQINKLVDAIEQETGVSNGAYNLTIQADVHVLGQTDYGLLDEVFNQTLQGTLKGNTLVWNSDLHISKPSALKISQKVPNSFRILGLTSGIARVPFSILSGFCLLCIILSAVINIRSKPLPGARLHKEIQRIGNRHKDIIAEASTVDGKPVTLASLNELIKVAHELGKPILHQVLDHEEEHVYQVLDGTIRYQYAFPGKPEPPSTNQTSPSP